MYEKILDIQRKGKLAFENIDWNEVGKYVSITYDDKELKELGIQSVIPKRHEAGNWGRKPGPAYWETDFIQKEQNGTKLKN